MDYKLKKYGWIAYMTSLLLYFAFLIFLTTFALVVLNPNTETCKYVKGDCIQYSLKVGWTNSMQLMLIIMCLKCVLRMTGSWQLRYSNAVQCFLTVPFIIIQVKLSLMAHLVIKSVVSCTSN